MNTAAKGRSFEAEIRELFRNAGYSVIRGAASKGELFENKVDLVASRITRENEFKTYLTIVGIQCKVKRRR